MEVRATTWWMGRAGTEGEDEAQFAVVLERAIAGDVSAFEQIVIRYERRVLTLAWRLLARIFHSLELFLEVFAGRGMNFRLMSPHPGGRQEVARTFRL
jgi:hypothetical protein